MKQPFRIGTRGSPLALTQARMVAEALRAAHAWGPERIEIVPITTSGDRIQDRPLAEVGGKALWTKELDKALLDGRTDMSVHSMKDVESIRPEALKLAAMLPRADVRDRLIGADSIEALPHWGRVGTSSPRRTAQLLARRPDLNIVAFRGNVATRLRKLQAGEADATLLAAAGLDRLGQSEIGTPVPDMLPAPSQGAVGIEMRADDSRLRAYLDMINDVATCTCVWAERRFLQALGGNCHSPVAALATIDGGEVLLQAEILTSDGKERETGATRFAAGDEDGPRALAGELLARAGPALRSQFQGEAAFS
jgi:hydroxymethylbilane synthase